MIITLSWPDGTESIAPYVLNIRKNKPFTVDMAEDIVAYIGLPNIAYTRSRNRNEYLRDCFLDRGKKA